MDDLISRQAAIDALDGEITITGKTNAEAVREYVKAVKCRIERIPPVQPKRGKWIYGEDEYCTWIPMSEQYKNKQSNCKNGPMPEPWKGET